ncbi:MAG: D-alanyl-D-alanine carboxypeptidase family protein [Gammaproteobacteria bacterium]
MTVPAPDTEHPSALHTEAAEIAAIHRELGIPPDYSTRTGLRLYTDAEDLAFVGEDVFGRPQRMTPHTAIQWQAMYKRAQAKDVILLLVSAFRSVRYQRELISHKLTAGQKIADILKVNAAPGYSEHHSGCALDLTTGDSASLDEGFENTRAFAWLGKHGGEFGFRMSYPRGNPHGITYEPWHWMCRDG